MYPLDALGCFLKVFDKLIHILSFGREVDTMERDNRDAKVLAHPNEAGVLDSRYVSVQTARVKTGHGSCLSCLNQPVQAV